MTALAELATEDIGSAKQKIDRIRFRVDNELIDQDERIELLESQNRIQATLILTLQLENEELMRGKDE